MFISGDPNRALSLNTEVIADFPPGITLNVLETFPSGSVALGPDGTLALSLGGSINAVAGSLGGHTATVLLTVAY